MAISISSSSSNSSLVFFCLSTIVYRMEISYDILSEEEVSEIIEFVKISLTHINSFDDRCVNSIIRIAAFLFAYSPLSGELVSFFSMNQLVVFLYSFFEYKYFSSCDETELFTQKFYSCLDYLHIVLSNSDINADWLKLLAISLHVFTDEFDPFFPYISHLQRASEIPSCYPNLIQFYEDLLCANDPNHLSKPEIEFIQEVISIMISVCSILLESAESDEMNISMATHIWSQTIDYGADFFYSCVPASFSADLFDQMIEHMKYISSYPQEFNSIAETASCTFENIIMFQECPFWAEIFSFLDLLIYVINEDPSSFSEIPIGKSFYNITSSGDINMFNYYNSLLSHPTTGVFYAVANSHERICSQVAPSFMKLLLSSECNASTALLFIKECCVYCSDYSMNCIEYCGSIFLLDPSIESAKALSSLSYHYPRVFAEYPDDIFFPILGWISVIEMNIMVYLITTVLNVVSFMELDANSLSQVFLPIENTIIDKINNIIDNNSFEDLSDFFRMIKILMKETYSEQRYNTTELFCKRLFIRLLNRICLFWENTNDFIQTCVASFIKGSYKFKWNNDIRIGFSWLDSVLFKSPNRKHMSLVSVLWCLTNRLSEGISTFISSSIPLDNPDLAISIMKVVSRLYEDKWAPFFTVFSASYFLSPLQSDSTVLIETTLELLSKLIERTNSHNFADQTLSSIINGMFSNFEAILFAKSISIIQSILLRFPLNISDYILGHYNVSNDHLTLFSQELLNEQSYLSSKKSALKLVYEHKCSQKS